MSSVLTLEAKLERGDSSTPWGFRMQGGKDFSSPLTIQRVNPGSLAAKCGLQIGDIILRIGNEDTGALRHKEAQNSILQAGNRLDLLLQRGGAPQRGGESNYQTFSPPAVSSSTLQNAGGYNQATSFNTAPKPFGSQQPTPAPFKPAAAFDNGLSQRTHNLSLSPGGSSDASSSSSSVASAIPASSASSFSAHPPPPPPPPPAPSAAQRGSEPAYLRSAAEKYSDMEEPARPSQHQSRSFKYLQDLMDSGKEPPKALKTSNPPALHARSVSPADDRSSSSESGSVREGPVQVVGPGKPGMVKAIMSQRYNTPIGLYSENEVMTQFEGQSKFLVSDDQDGEGSRGSNIGGGGGGFPPPPPPPTTMVHHAHRMEPAPTSPPLPPPPPPQSQPPPSSSLQQQQENGGSMKYFPSETYKMIQEEEQGSLSARGGAADDKSPLHSRSFLKLQKELGSSGGPAPSSQFAAKPAASSGGGFQPKSVIASSAAKTWTPKGPPPPALAPNKPAHTGGPPRPFAAMGMAAGAGAGGAAPKPTGVGAKRGRVGEAVTNPGSGPGGRIPVCAGCGAPIRGPFVTAMGKCWCPDHFICANPGCGTKLIDIGFVEEGGNLYCEKDYEKYLAPHCNKCNKPILGECVNALTNTWHPDCFLCTHCKQPIGGNQFHIEDGKPYCERDWAAMFQTMCAGCDFPIEPGDRWVEAMSKNFHAECFNCATCQVSLEGQPFVAKAGKAFCKNHAR